MLWDNYGHVDRDIYIYICTLAGKLNALCLQQRDNRIAQLACRRLSSQISRANSFVQYGTNGIFHLLGLSLHVQRVPEHQGHAEDHSHGVGHVFPRQAVQVHSLAMSFYTDAVGTDTYVGAEPCVGSYNPADPHPFKLALGNTPNVPIIEPAWSEIISPKVLSASRTPLRARGFVARINDAESASWCTSCTWGYSSRIVFSTTRRQSRDDASTLALSSEITGQGGLCRWANSAARRVMRWTSGVEYAHGSIAFLSQLVKHPGSTVQQSMALGAGH